MQYLHIFVQNCNTRCSQRCKCSSTRGIPINLVLLDGQKCISTLHIYELVWGLGVIGLKWDYFAETPLFDPIFLNIVSYSCLWLTPSVIFFADLERLDNFLSENVYFSYTSMYTLEITVVQVQNVTRHMKFADETQAGPTSRRMAICERASLESFGVFTFLKLLFPSIFLLVLHILCLRNILNFRCQITSAFI